MDHLYIRHTVGGRLFLDSIKHETPFAIEPAANRDGWKIMIEIGDRAHAEGICSSRDELNIFFVPGGAADRKTWFFSTHGEVEYDVDRKQLIIWADGRIDYNV
ncbi:hypothetical protein [Paenibacillus sacheonensis]|uniref:Uncharacterized protein n=1 Tax=Paenibacillus sacheonensis TaxID=742054 RepID=A0A7X4YUZ9_9BACL|nr:hypothetical protein [Paenibacillus sacheonensis]MBM7568400.1 hypothetical protein [Paenibacillus sacheonensis]NBC72099.1 hypothetical protein [Paenibacillus sacheonensis]